MYIISFKIFSLSNFITLMRPLDPDLDNFGAAQEPTKSSLLANGYTND